MLRDRWGVGKLERPEGTVVCQACLDANEGAELACNPMPVSVAEKMCHACGGLGQVWDRSAQRLTSVGSKRRAPGGKALARGREKKCGKCRGKGRVPA